MSTPGPGNESSQTEGQRSEGGNTAGLGGSGTPGGTATPPGTARRTRWVLVASLALNVALLAGFAWQHLHDDGPRHGPPGHPLRGGMMPSPRLLRGALPAERQAVVDAILEKHRAGIRASVRDVFEARRAVHAQLTADTVDADAMEAAFADLRTHDAAAASAVQAMLTDLATELTPEERRAVADAMHRHPRGRRHRDRNAPTP
ncbi:hypothetical protein GCM10028862_01890 [Luteimonas pelagia]